MNSVSICDNYSLGIEKHKFGYRYSFMMDGEVLSSMVDPSTPSSLNINEEFFEGIIKRIGKEGVSGLLKEALDKLQPCADMVDLEPGYNELVELLDSSNLTIIDYIRICINNLIAGEEKNVLAGLLCHLSTYFGKQPLWYMVIGRSGDGKSTIEKASVDLLPDNAYMDGNITKAALLRLTMSRGNDYLDRKILRLGDLGGKDDLKKMEDVLNVYKQLATEGHISSTFTEDTPKEEGADRGGLTLDLDGRCSISLTTVHTEVLDEQFRSRGRLFEPEASNNDVLKFNRYYEGLYKRKVDALVDKYVNNLLHDYIEYVSLCYSDIEVLNPYQSCLVEWLDNDENFKRSLKQYINLVKTVTLLNYPQREIVTNVEGKKFLLSTRSDNELVTELFTPGFGLSPVAIKTFNKLLDWFYGCESEEEYLNKTIGELDLYDEGALKSFNMEYCFCLSKVRDKARDVKNLRGLVTENVLESLMLKGLITPTESRFRGMGKHIYRLDHFKEIVNPEITFNKHSIRSYLRVLKQTQGVDLDLDSLVDRENQDDLSDCRIGDLEVPGWY